MGVRGFHIDVEQSVLDDLQLRLRQTRRARVAGDDGWDFGTSPEFTKALVDYWQTEFDWRKQELRLNELPHYKARIHGNDVHFVHARGTGDDPLPLLLLHGWPDSFYRYHKIIPPLSDPVASGQDELNSFHVVVPSLPGFGFTGRVKFPEEGRPTRQAAHLLWQLMTETLGYERFAVAGGDGGSVIAQILAIDHPESVIGVHLTDLGWHVTNVDASALTKPEQKYLEEASKRFLKEGAYAMVQTTKPNSLTVALNDSPVALASWIVDRFYGWSDHNGNILNSYTMDELLTNIMIYWSTQTIGPSIYNYYAEANSPSLLPEEYVAIPVAVALFPKDIGGVPPRAFAERTLNVQRWTEMPHGGHFAAWEVPELYTNDIVAFFGTFRGAESEARSIKQ